MDQFSKRVEKEGFSLIIVPDKNLVMKSTVLVTQIPKEIQSMESEENFAKVYN